MYGAFAVQARIGTFVHSSGASTIAQVYLIKKEANGPPGDQFRLGEAA